jgi:hypothetical protein
MTQNKSFAERRDEAAEEHVKTATLEASKVTHRGLIDSLQIYAFNSGANFGYRTALEDMGAAVEALKQIIKPDEQNEADVARDALDLFAKLKKESEGEG